MKIKQIMAVVAIGAVGVAALAACSSGSDQTQAGREAAPSAASPSSAATPTGSVLKAPKGSMFADVTVTHADPASCTRKEVGDQLVVECSDVWTNSNVGVGDQVFIRVPNKHYRIDVQRFQDPSDSTPLRVLQRDWLYFLLNSSTDDHTVWNWPYKRQDQTGVPWGVGINSTNEYDSVAFKAVVSKVW